jgi:hypothetical protein
MTIMHEEEPMHGYVDPFAHRWKRSISAEDHLDAPSDGATPDVADDDEREDDPEPIGLDAIVDDEEHGRREAPLADDPSHRVRSR